MTRTMRPSFSGPPDGRSRYPEPVFLSRFPAFPLLKDLEGVEPEDLKVKAKVGYRADRILRLAKSFRDGTVDPAWLEGPERTRYFAAVCSRTVLTRVAVLR